MLQVKGGQVSHLWCFSILVLWHMYCIIKDEAAAFNNISSHMTITNQPRHLQKMRWTKHDVPTNYWYLMATCPIEFAFAWAYILAHMVNAKKLENWSVPWTTVKWVLRGVYDRGIKELASLSSQDLHGRNASPNLYRFIHKKNRTLPIAISAVKIPVKVRKPSQVISKQWPVLHLSSWLRTCMTDPNGWKNPGPTWCSTWHVLKILATIFLCGWLSCTRVTGHHHPYLHSWGWRAGSM